MAFLANIRLGQKGSSTKNTLAYFTGPIPRHFFAVFLQSILLCHDTQHSGPVSSALASSFVMLLGIFIGMLSVIMLRLFRTWMYRQKILLLFWLACTIKLFYLSSFNKLTRLQLSDTSTLRKGLQPTKVEPFSVEHLILD